jgi:hypothetical protein
MSGTQTVLSDKINKIKFDRDKKLRFLMSLSVPF